MEDLPNREGKYEFCIKEKKDEEYFVGKCFAFVAGFDGVDRKVELSDLVAVGSPLEITPRILRDNGWGDSLRNPFAYDKAFYNTALKNMPEGANAFMTLFEDWPARVIQYFAIDVKKK